MTHNQLILLQVSKSHKRGDDLIGDFCDGLLFKCHPLFQHDPLALQLITYYDEVEVCNPLGSHRGTNKLGRRERTAKCHSNY